MKMPRRLAPLGALLLGATLACAQGGSDFSKVQIKASKVADNSTGGTTDPGTSPLAFGS